MSDNGFDTAVYCTLEGPLVIQKGRAVTLDGEPQYCIRIFSADTQIMLRFDSREARENFIHDLGAVQDD